MKKYFIIIFVFLYSCNYSSKTNLTEQKNSQWRGENRDGIYNETNLLKEWHSDGPALLWTYEGLGDGHTSVAIANGKIYVTGYSDEKLKLNVLDLKGQLLIKKEIGDDFYNGHPGPRSTVCVNDGKLYIYNSLGKLFCLDEASLDEVWTKDLFKDFGGVTLWWGVTESPLIVGDKIFMTPGGPTHNIVAFNKNTGELIWSSAGEGTRSAYCSPQFIDGYSVPIVVTSTFEYIIAVNADTGEMLWSFPRTSEWNNHPNTPLYHNGMIFSPTGDGGGAVMLRLKNGGKEVELAWENPEVDTQMGGAIKIGDYVYASGNKNRFWFCVDWNTGETMYKVRDMAACNVISADGMLYCYSERGTMNFVKPNPEKFELISSFEVTLGDGGHWAHPVIHNGILYIRHGDALMAYSI